LALHPWLEPVATDFRVVDRANPYASYSAERLERYIVNRGVSRPGDAPFRYSNLGVGLLGHALATRVGREYADLLRDVITGPLGLRDTVIALSDEHRRRFLQGHDDGRRPVHEWDLNALAPAGGLRSTVTDLLMWAEANLHPERLAWPTLSAGIARTHQKQTRAGALGAIGLAWFIRDDLGGLWHGGATAGFTSDVWLSPAEDLAVVVLSNTGPASSLSADIVATHVRAEA
jgi:CubicO group peptidase (beta-lactamase class C family)